MQAMAIPRFEPGAAGIHLIWMWPDVLPLSEDGYDVQRRGLLKQSERERCETIDRRIIEILLARGEYPAPLGPLRLRRGVRFAPITDPTLLPRNPSVASDHPAGFAPKGAAAARCR